ncbi:GATA transcription factor 7-like [Phragmites australis]|uniref:GATA transcription factor 7-like n=1 Tax=Phragmites australis TaxID=29695 RepID=UPI002D783A85|nr:GATA transcription factor 7-like [Phragmites australis]
MDVHPSNAAANSLGDLFPHEPALEGDDSSLEWLSVYVEDCFSSSVSYANPISVKPVSTMANQSAGKPKLLPPSSSNGRKKRRSLASVMSDEDDGQEYFPLFVEPPLLLLDQQHWLAESELILPRKDKDQELGQQQEKEQEEEKCEKDAGMQFQQERLVKRCSNCLSNQTPRWRHGPSGLTMLCNACGLRLKPENRFTTVSKQCDQGTNREQELGKRRGKKKIKKTANASEELPPEQPVKRCTHCMSFKTPQWRAGPLGPKTLCNACGVRFKSGRLLPEYRPANSPTFVSDMHSNSHKKVLQLRQSVEHNGR